MTSLEKVGLKLNAAKTKALTTQAQPPKTLTTRAGLEMAGLDQSSSHKWLGCMLSTENAGTRQDDIDHRLQCAARAFRVQKWILCDKMVSMASRLKFFDAMITSVVCFAAGHRKIYTTDLRKLDVHCRKLLRRVVGPPADIDWNQPWHTILHAWHRRIDQQLEYHGFKMGSHFPFCHITSQLLRMTMLRLKGCTNCWIRCCRVWAGHLAALFLEAISTLVLEACNLGMTCIPWAGGVLVAGTTVACI